MQTRLTLMKTIPVIEKQNNNLEKKLQEIEKKTDLFYNGNSKEDYGLDLNEAVHIDLDNYSFRTSIKTFLKFKNSKISKLVLQDLKEKKMKNIKISKDNPVFIDLDGSYFR